MSEEKLRKELGIDEYLELIKEDKNLNGAYVSLGQYMYYLENKNQELKETNKVLSQELTKDKLLKQDTLTTCCGIPIVDISKIKHQRNLYKSVIDEVRKYIENKIQKSFKYDFGLNNNHEDRLLTETVVELQLILGIVKKAD